MTLLEFIRQPSNSPVGFAAELGIAQAYLYQLAHGIRPISPKRAVLIEQATGGAVKRWDLRPDDWHHIWPELRQHPEAPKAKEAA